MAPCCCCAQACAFVGCTALPSASHAAPEMADDSGSSDIVCATRNNWELVFCEKSDHLSAEASSSLSGNLEHEQSTDEPCFYTNDLLNMDYFAAPSKVSTIPHEMGDSVVANNASLEAGKKVASNPELDWIEPSTPIRSCLIGTSEDDDSSSRSCSSDSREGSREHLLREKDAVTFDREPYIGDYPAVLHDVPMDALQESHAELSGGIDDEGGGNGAPWRRYLRAWLSEAGRASTFCSIALAAAVIGLVLVGSGWHRIRLQYQKFRCRFFCNGKGITQVMYQLVQIKGSSSKLQKVPVLKTRSCFSGV